MKHRFHNFIAAFWGMALFLSLTGCKEDTIIKAKVAPGVDGVNVIATSMPFNCKTVYDDSVITSKVISGLPVLAGVGNINDGFFGQTQWGVYLQVAPSAANFALPQNCDSAVLVLPYSGFRWGDTTDATVTQSYQAYEVTDTMSVSATYYSKTVKNYNATPVGAASNVNISRLIKDSVKVAGLNRGPHLRIKLTQDFINKMLSQAAGSTSNADYVSKVPGIYVSSTTSNGRLVPFFYLDGSADYSRAGVIFYYHITSTDPDSVKSASFSFVTADCAHYNYIQRNYASAPANNYINKDVDSILLVQNEPGAAIDIKIPNLGSLPVALVNKAELVFTKISIANDPEADMTTGKYKLFEPARLFPYVIDASGATTDVLDAGGSLVTQSSLDFVDGSKRTITVNGMDITQYVINIPREVQRAIVNKTDTLHLRINGTTTFPGAYRLVAGGKRSMYQAALNITYSKLK